MAGDATIVAGRRVAERYRLVKARSNTEWDAVDETLRRNVVVHLLPADAAPEAKEHFTAEARTLARLNHRNVVATYDTGVDGDGTSYRVDELPRGEPVEPHGLDDQRRLSYAIQTVRALVDAHSLGLVHGALTSANVLVDDGRVRVSGLRVPRPTEDAEGARTSDIAALTRVVLALAPATATPLRDVASRWQVAVPTSSAAMLDELVALPDDDVDIDIPPPTPPSTGVPAVRPRGRQWLIVSVAAVVLAAIAAAVVLPGQGGDDEPLGPLVLTARSFDPEATPPTENESDARFVVDGSASTGWATERYRSRNFGNLKSGLGLILQSQSGVVEFNQIVITSSTRNWDVELYVAEEPATSLSGWGRALASATVRNETTTILVNGARGSAALLWISDPGPNLQVRINEVAAQGRK